MKLFRTISVFTIALCFLISSTSCLVFTRHDVSGGSPRGWHKNTNNPHNPNTTNPGHTKGKGRGHK